jgi:hypothetical protein
VDGKQNVVCLISWELHGANKSNTTSFVYGNQEIAYAENASFVDFQDLTKEQVIQWLIESIGQTHVLAYKKIVAEKIDLIQNPKIITLPLPWAE